MARCSNSWGRKACCELAQHYRATRGKSFMTAPVVVPDFTTTWGWFGKSSEVQQSSEGWQELGVSSAVERARIMSNLHAQDLQQMAFRDCFKRRVQFFLCQEVLSTITFQQLLAISQV